MLTSISLVTALWRKIDHGEPAVRAIPQMIAPDSRVRGNRGRRRRHGDEAFGGWLVRREPGQVDDAKRHQHRRRPRTTDATTASATIGAPSVDGAPGRRGAKGFTRRPPGDKSPAPRSAFETAERLCRPARTVGPVRTVPHTGRPPPSSSEAARSGVVLLHASIIGRDGVARYWEEADRCRSAPTARKPLSVAA